MKKIFTLLLVIIFGVIQAQVFSQTEDNFIHYLNETNFKKGIQKGVVVVEFNAPFNLNNSFSEWKQIEHCRYYRVCIDGSPDLKEKYKIWAVPTIVVFQNGHVEKKFTGNIMLEIDIETKQLQETVDELYLDKF